MKRVPRLVVLSLVVALLGLPATASAGPAATPPTGTTASAPGATQAAVIVQAPGAEADAAAAVRRLGGTVTRALPIVSGFAATLPADAVTRLAAEPGVRAVTPDGTMTPAESKDRSSRDHPVKSVFRREVGADLLNWIGVDGAGVRVALIDTGVSTQVATSGDLAGRIVPVDDPAQPPTLLRPDPPDVACVNFSGEPDCDDTFGHGTFMAGLIAGSGAASGGYYAGVAPAAEIVSVKVGGRDGSADVSKVLAGIQWVVSFADRYGIKVLNLSLGTDSTVPPSIDPLNLAVQRAWVSGITVVVAAGNFGPGPRTASDGSTYGTITKPGDDPYVITVGAVDDRGTPATADDRVPSFSSWGPTPAGLAKPDIAAPGARVVSLRAPGSTVDGLPGVIDDTYRRGSGTSMSAAVTSGLAALLLDFRDGSHGLTAWRPDDVKAALIAGARRVQDRDPRAVGAGLVNGPFALLASISPTYQTSVLSDGTGTLDGSRGTNLVEPAEPCEHATLDPLSVDDCGLVESGEETAQGNNWQSAEYADSEWTPQSWYESQWVVGLSGNNWQTSVWAAGNNWQGNNWQGNNWQGNNWQGSTWDDQTEHPYGTPIRGSGSYGAWG